MSGTSMDGIDAVVMEIRDAGPGRPPDWRVEAFETAPYSPERRRAIESVVADGSPASVAALHAALGEWLAEAALSVCRSAGLDPADVDVIGSHGQTVWHSPPTGPSPKGPATGSPAERRDRGRGRGPGEGPVPTGPGPGSSTAAGAAADPELDLPGRGCTLQLGDPATVAERTGVPVVADFRSRDMAAGGHGAPLVPWVDRLLFAGEAPRTLVNIGGMANVTRVPARGSDEPVVAFDTGPGNAIIDAAVSLATGGERAYDVDGEWARRGRVDEARVEELLADPWFRRPPPKSTGRERFGRPYVEALAPGGSDREGWEGLVATLTDVVARAIADGVVRWADPGVDGEVVVTGGGVENPALMERLRTALEPRAVLRGDVLGVDPAAKEAVAFAVLAWAHVTGRPGNVPSATGAAGPRVLGSLTPGRRRPPAGRAS